MTFSLAARRLDALHINHRRIARGAFLTSLFVLAAKGTIALREVAIAWRYGVSSVVDSYQLAFMVATWVPIIIVSIGSNVLIPRFVALQADPPRRRHFVDELNLAALLIGLAITALLFLTAPAVVTWIGQGLESSAQELTITMVRWFAPIGLLTVLGGTYAIRLQARERFAFSLTEAAPAVTTVLFIVLAPPSVGVAPLILGTTIGAVVQILFLGPMTHYADGGIGGVSASPRSRVWPSLYGSLAFMALGQFIFTAALPIDQAFAAGLGEGSLSVLGYANRLLGLATGLGAVIITRALLPVLAGVAADGALELGRRQTLKWSWVMVGAGAFAAVVGWVMAPWAVSMIFERGAFRAEDTTHLARVFRYGLVQLPFYLGGIVYVQWFAATKRFDILLYVAIGALLIKIAFNYLLVTPLGLAGILLATSMMYGASFAVQSVLIRMRLWSS